jgi:hypothetical protein
LEVLYGSDVQGVWEGCQQIGLGKEEIGQGGRGSVAVQTFREKYECLLGEERTQAHNTLSLCWELAPGKGVRPSLY